MIFAKIYYEEIAINGKLNSERSKRIKIACK